MPAPKLEELFAVVKNLGGKHLAHFKKFIPIFDANATTQKRTREMVAELAKFDRAPTPAILKQVVAKGTTLSTYPYLQRTAIERALEYMLLDHYLHSDAAPDGIVLSESLRKGIECRKLVAKALLVAAHGGRTIAIEKLHKAVEIAKHYEVFAPLTDALHYLHTHAYVSGNNGLYAATRSDLNHYRDQHGAFLRAFESYAHFHFTSNFSGVQQTECAADLREVLPGIKQDFDRFRSDRIGYFYYSLSAEYYCLLNAPELAQDSYAALLTLLQDSKPLAIPYLFSKARVDLASVYLDSFDFDRSVGELALAQKTVPTGKTLHQLMKEIEALAHCFKNDFYHAALAITTSKDWTDRELFPLDWARRTYIEACIEFLRGNVQQCFLLLLDTKILEGEKDGWNIGIRVLQCLVQIEKSNFDQADYLVEALRKHIERLRKRGHNVRERETAIFELLRSLSANSYDFRTTSTSAARHLAQLRSLDGTVRWYPKSFEVIPIHLWFEAKQTGQPIAFELWQEAMEWTLDKSRIVSARVA